MTYTINYKVCSCSDEKQIQVKARSKEQAYDLAVYDEIYYKENQLPYSAWVESVTYSNGKVHYFNTSEGNAY